MASPLLAVDFLDGSEGLAPFVVVAFGPLVVAGVVFPWLQWGIAMRAGGLPGLPWVGLSALVWVGVWSAFIGLTGVVGFGGWMAFLERPLESAGFFFLVCAWTVVSVVQSVLIGWHLRRTGARWGNRWFVGPAVMACVAYAALLMALSNNALANVLGLSGFAAAAFAQGVVAERVAASSRAAVPGTP